MKHIQRFIFSLATLILASSVALTAPTYARDGQSGSGSDDNAVTQAASDDSTTGTTSPESEHLAEQFREQAQEKLQHAKEGHQQKTEAQREKACTVRKAVIAKRMTNAVTQANKHKAVFDKIYTRVKDFYTTKQLNVSNYADLTAKVDTAAANAQTSIDALSALDINVDCTSQTVSASVGAFQSAVKSSRDSLKAYRSSIVDLITALKGASTGTSDSSTNSTDQ
jgi:hypothetical protein